MSDPARGWLSAISGTEARLERDVSTFEEDLRMLFPQHFKEVGAILRQAQEETNSREEIEKAAGFV